MRVLIGCATSCVALDAFLARGHDACRVWQFGFQDTAMGWGISADDAKAECERMERNSR